MIKLRVLLALSAGLLLAGCTPDAAAPTSSASESATPSPSATSPESPTAAVVAGFELSGTELVSVDADGDEIAHFPFTDPTALIAAITAFRGAPHVEPATPECDVDIAQWPDASGTLVVAYSVATGRSIVVVKDGSHSIQPSAGPGFGEPALAYAATLPAGQVSDTAYVYDVSGTRPDGQTIGAVAFFAADGTVDSLASPTAPYGSEFC